MKKTFAGLGVLVLVALGATGVTFPANALEVQPVAEIVVASDAIVASPDAVLTQSEPVVVTSPAPEPVAVVAEPTEATVAPAEPVVVPEPVYTAPVASEPVSVPVYAEDGSVISDPATYYSEPVSVPSCPATWYKFSGGECVQPIVTDYYTYPDWTEKQKQEMALNVQDRPEQVMSVQYAPETDAVAPAKGQVQTRVLCVDTLTIGGPKPANECR